jgi:hypothetical protein
MQATVNGVEVYLLMDNGNLWDPLLFWGGPRTEALGMHPDGEIEVGGSGEGEPIMSTTASGVTVEFDDVRFTDQPAIIMPSDSNISQMWKGSDGQLSAVFFKHFVVGIDFDKSVITLTRPEQFDPRGAGREIAMQHLGEGAWAIPVTLKIDAADPITLPLQLDLGMGNPLELRADAEGDVPMPAKTIEASLGFGVQGETRGHYGRVRRVTIGGFEIRDVRAGFRIPTDRGEIDERSYLGISLLYRFNVVFDYPHQRMFIRPSRRFDEPFHFSLTGLEIIFDAERGLVVRNVVPLSPAEKSGVEAGDVITAIDGKPVLGAGSEEIQAMFRKEGATVVLTIARDNEEYERRLTLKPVI